MQKALKSYKFKFPLPKDLILTQNHFKVRLHRKDFFISLDKNIISNFKKDFCDTLIVLKIKNNFVSGYIKFSKEISHDKVASILKLTFHCNEQLKNVWIKDDSFNSWNIDIQAPKGYWNEALNSKQSNEELSVRMSQILKGFYLDDCINLGKEITKNGLIEFWNSKRPYGNKEVQESIVFNLGWDWARVLCWDKDGLPDYVKLKTDSIHELVLEILKR